jgi:hypothetical protein
MSAEVLVAALELTETERLVLSVCWNRYLILTRGCRPMIRNCLTSWFADGGFDRRFLPRTWKTR